MTESAVPNQRQGGGLSHLSPEGGAGSSKNKITPPAPADVPRDIIPRIVSQFSCGAASAVATKLVLAEYPRERVIVVNAYLKEEHADNERFRVDCERWWDHPITRLADQKYGASAQQVWKRVRFLKQRNFAPCSSRLKKDVLDTFLQPNDIYVIGFTAEEEDRLDRYHDANAGRQVLTPLMDRGLKKADCLAMLERAGIALPAMYRLGYNNNNCIGCCKGGEGYWNKIRVDFPEVFEEVCQIQDLLGPGSYLFRDRHTGERFGLRQLPPDKGRHDEVEISCSIFCEMAYNETQP